MKSVFKSLDHVFNSQTGKKHFGSRLLLGLVEGLKLSYDNPFDFHAMIVSASPVSIAKAFEIC